MQILMLAANKKPGWWKQPRRHTRGWGKPQAHVAEPVHHHHYDVDEDDEDDEDDEEDDRVEDYDEDDRGNEKDKNSNDQE